MMLTILIGRAKTGKSKQILRRIRELGDTGKQILLVPEHASFQTEVDLCRACGNRASRHAEVLSFRRLCDRVLSETGGLADVTLDAGGKLLVLQKALLEVSPMLRVYRRPSQKAAFLQQMLDLFDELHCYEVPPAMLFERTAEMEDGVIRDKLTDLSLIYANYESYLRRPGSDSRDHMSKLVDHLEESGYVCGKDIFIDGFSYFNGQEIRVLRILLRQANSVTVALLGEQGSQEEVFESSQKTMTRLRELAKEYGRSVTIVPTDADRTTALGHLEQCFFGANRIYEEETSAIRIREADHIFSEVEQTAADIRRLVAEKKCRYRDITVSARNMNEYANVIEVVFERYGIPTYHSRRSDILEKPVLSLLTGVLASVEDGYEYEDMFRWLKTGLAGLTTEECDLLENYVLKWEIHGGMWLRDTDWKENPDGYGMPFDERRQACLTKVNELRRRVQGNLALFAGQMKISETVGEKVNALYEFMERLGLQQALELQMQTQAEAGRMQDAEETVQLWDILCSVLDQFVERLGTERVSLEEFSRLFRQVLTQYSVGTIPVSLDRVSVSEMTRNDRHAVGYLFFLGVNDHVIPGNVAETGILNEDDRDELERLGIHLAPGGAERMGMEMQKLYAALAQPDQGLIISYPVADVSGNELRPAFVIERLQKLFPAVKIEKESAGKEYRLAAEIPALESAGQNPDGGLWRYLEKQPALHQRLEAMRCAAELKRGSLSQHAVRSLYGEKIAMSASRLERLRSCHFAYFMEYGLRAKLREPAAFDAPQIGTFLHYLLENVTRDVLKAGGFAQVENHTLHELVRQYIDCYIAQELGNFQEKSARFQYLFSRLRSTAYAVIEQIAEEMRHSDFVPLEFELSFGDHGTLPAVVVSEPDVELRVGGKVDRVDGWVKDDKLYLRVVDYKSGRKSFDLSAVKMGLDIQMLLYLFALQKEGAAYFGKEIEPAGVLYFPARDEILSAERNVLPDKLAKEREKVLKRSGLVLAEPEVLKAMEHESLTEPHYLPLRVSRDGNLSGSIASAAQLGRLGKYVNQLLHQIAGEIRSGNIDADPCCHSEDDSFCKYCDWVNACHFQDGRDGDRLQYILPMKPEEFWKTLEEEGGGSACLS